MAPTTINRSSWKINQKKSTSSLPMWSKKLKDANRYRASYAYLFKLRQENIEFWIEIQPTLVPEMWGANPSRERIKKSYLSEQRECWEDEAKTKVVSFKDFRCQRGFIPSMSGSEQHGDLKRGSSPVPCPLTAFGVLINRTLNPTTISQKGHDTKLRPFLDSCFHKII